MKSGYWITLKNGSDCVLDSRFVEYEDQIRDAIVTLLADVGFMAHGDKIEVLEGESEVE